MILFSHVLKEYLKFVFGTVVLCLFLFILFDFIHKAGGYFSRYAPSSLLITKYYIYQIPMQLVQILPIGSLLSSVITMVLYNRSNEITAMRAAGMSPGRVVMPLACGGLILTLFSYLLNEVIVPWSSQKMYHITKVLIEGADAHGVSQQAHWVRQDVRVFSFRDYDHTQQTLIDVELLTIDRDFVPQRALHAEMAKYRQYSQDWSLHKVKEVRIEPDGELVELPGPTSQIIKLPVDPSKLSVDRRTPDEVALSELGERIRLGASRGADVLHLRISWHVKTAYPLAALLISFLGLKFGYRSERTTETVRSILMAFGVGISYWFILSASRVVAGAGDIPPFLGAWTANIIIALIVVWQFAQVHKM